MKKKLLNYSVCFLLFLISMKSFSQPCQNATVTAGPDQTICAGSTATLAGAFGSSISTATWTAGGGGTFSPNASTLNATFTPSASQVTAGSATLTLTTNDPNGTCPAVNDQMVITINPAAIVNAGSDQTVCAGSTVTLAGTKGGSATSATWSGATGTFNPNATTLTATYTPSASEITAGSVTLTLTSNDPAGPCPAVNDQMILTINPSPTVNAGVDQTVCAGSSVTLAGTKGGGATTATWSGGSGTFNPGATTLTATYTPSASEVTAGSLTLTLTSNTTTCGTGSDQMIITINPAATVDAGIDQTICSGNSATLAGAIGGSASSATWSGGAGTFNPNATTLTATYTPSGSEIAAGSVTLTLTSNDPAGPCPAVNDQMVITINPSPTINAGVDQTICAGSSVTLAGTKGGLATGATWSGGSGTFNPNVTTLNATYTPTASEITAGSLTLTLTSNTTTCGSVNDQMVITINPSATVDASSDQTICAGSSATLAGAIGGSASSATWSGGLGTFNPDANTLNAVYTPDASEVTAGTVTLTLTTDDPSGPCGSVNDQMVITINPSATVDAGIDQTICAGSSATLAGSIGGSASSGTWSGGLGTFNPDANTLNAVYTPDASEITAGTVTLTLTTDDPSGPCGSVNDQVVITINPVATVDAGIDQTICAVSSATLAGSIGGSASSATWSGGLGTFNPDANTLNAVYTPDASEITAGTVTLTLTTDDPSGPCGSVNDQVVITINPAATVDAGIDQTICAGSSATLAGSIGGSASSGTWSGGLGTFNPDANTLNAVYTPDASEVTAGTVTLTLTTDDPSGPCGSVFDQMVISINPVATVDAGIDQTICAGSSATLAGSIGGSASSATWSGGLGAFNPSASSLNAIYTPSASEIAAGTVALTLTTNDPSGSCGSVNDQMVITINPAATVNAGSDQTICSGRSATLAGSIGGSASSATWSGGTGAFNPSASSLNATYTPSASEIAAGMVALTLTTNDPAGSCGSVNDQMVITINSTPSVKLGPDITSSTSVFLNAGNAGSTYHWNTGATTQSITVTVSGNYIVTVTNVHGCSASDTIHVDILSVGIEDITITEHFKIYPNPNNGDFNLNFSVQNAQNVEIKMINFIGEEIYKEVLGNFSGTYKKMINVPCGFDGMYLLQIFANGKVYSEKIIITK